MCRSPSGTRCKRTRQPGYRPLLKGCALPSRTDLVRSAGRRGRANDAARAASLPSFPYSDLFVLNSRFPFLRARRARFLADHDYRLNRPELYGGFSISPATQAALYINVALPFKRFPSPRKSPVVSGEAVHTGGSSGCGAVDTAIAFATSALTVSVIISLMPISSGRNSRRIGNPPNW